MIIYKNYVIVKGAGEDNASNINAFDAALMKAKISEVNLVGVSSILPENCIELDAPPKLKIGEVVFCVLARLDGKKGEKISAGIACVHGERNGKKYGLVMEAHNNVDKEDLEQDLKERIKSMLKLRDFKVYSTKIVVESIPEVKDNFGSAIVALVYR
ncbi:MAG: pyruvoyl-dependent arginine decarboxylase [Candidatus Shapirobacteria bacterium]